MSCELNKFIIKLANKYNTSQTIIKSLINSLKEEIKCCLKCDNSCDYLLLDETIKNNYLYRIFKTINHCEKDLLLNEFCKNVNPIYNLKLYPSVGSDNLNIGEFRCNNQTDISELNLIITNGGNQIIPAGTIFNLNITGLPEIGVTANIGVNEVEENDFFVSAELSVNFTTLTIYEDFVPYDFSNIEENTILENNSMINLNITFENPNCEILSLNINIINDDLNINQSFIIESSISTPEPEYVVLNYIDASSNVICDTNTYDSTFTITFDNSDNIGVPSGMVFYIDSMSVNYFETLSNLVYDNSIIEIIKINNDRLQITFLQDFSNDVFTFSYVLNFINKCIGSSLLRISAEQLTIDQNTYMSYPISFTVQSV